MSFEDSLSALEEIAKRLEDGTLGLDDSIAEFERGIKLAQFCHKKLEEAERKIEMLQKTGGEIESKSLKVKEDTGEIENEDDLQGSLL